MNKGLSQAHDEATEAAVKRLGRTVALLQDRIRLLEEENVRFADMLTQRGVDVRPSSKIGLELPPAVREPLDGNAEVLALMTLAERKLLDDLCPNEQVLLLLKSDSRTDTGSWLRGGRVWVCATRKELVLLAAGRKPLIQKTPFPVLRESLYNHVTGEVVLAPAGELTLNRIKVPPLEGYQLLAQIYDQEREK